MTHVLVKFDENTQLLLESYCQDVINEELRNELKETLKKNEISVVLLKSLMKDVESRQQKIDLKKIMERSSLSFRSSSKSESNVHVYLKN